MANALDRVSQHVASSRSRQQMLASRTEVGSSYLAKQTSAVATEAELWDDISACQVHAPSGPRPGPRPSARYSALARVRDRQAACREIDSPEGERHADANLCSAVTCEDTGLELDMLQATIAKRIAAVEAGIDGKVGQDEGDGASFGDVRNARPLRHSIHHKRHPSVYSNIDTEVLENEPASSSRSSIPATGLRPARPTAALGKSSVIAAMRKVRTDEQRRKQRLAEVEATSKRLDDERDRNAGCAGATAEETLLLGSDDESRLTQQSCSNASAEADEPIQAEVIIRQRLEMRRSARAAEIEVAQVSKVCSPTSETFSRSSSSKALDKGEGEHESDSPHSIQRDISDNCSNSARSLATPAQRASLITWEELLLGDDDEEEHQFRRDMSEDSLFSLDGTPTTFATVPASSSSSKRNSKSKRYSTNSTTCSESPDCLLSMVSTASTFFRPASSISDAPLLEEDSYEKQPSYELEVPVTAELTQSPLSIPCDIFESQHEGFHCAQTSFKPDTVQCNFNPPSSPFLSHPLNNQRGTTAHDLEGPVVATEVSPTIANISNTVLCNAEPALEELSGLPAFEAHHKSFGTNTHVIFGGKSAIAEESPNSPSKSTSLLCTFEQPQAEDAALLVLRQRQAARSAARSQTADAEPDDILGPGEASIAEDLQQSPAVAVALPFSESCGPRIDTPSAESALNEQLEALQCLDIERPSCTGSAWSIPEDMQPNLEALPSSPSAAAEKTTQELLRDDASQGGEELATALALPHTRESSRGADEHEESPQSQLCSLGIDVEEAKFEGLDVNSLADAPLRPGTRRGRRHISSAAEGASEEEEIDFDLPPCDAATAFGMELVGDSPTFDCFCFADDISDDEASGSETFGLAERELEDQTLASRDLYVILEHVAEEDRESPQEVSCLSSPSDSRPSSAEFADEVQRRQEAEPMPDSAPRESAVVRAAQGLAQLRAQAMKHAESSAALRLQAAWRGHASRRRSSRLRSSRVGGSRGAAKCVADGGRHRSGSRGSARSSSAKGASATTCKAEEPARPVPRSTGLKKAAGAVSAPPPQSARAPGCVASGRRHHISDILSMQDGVGLPRLPTPRGASSTDSGASSKTVRSQAGQPSLRRRPGSQGRHRASSTPPAGAANAACGGGKVQPPMKDGAPAKLPKAAAGSLSARFNLGDLAAAAAVSSPRRQWG